MINGKFLAELLDTKEMNEATACGIAKNTLELTTILESRGQLTKKSVNEIIEKIQDNLKNIIKLTDMEH